MSVLCLFDKRDSETNIETKNRKTMCKSNVFQHVLDETSAETEVLQSVILSSDKSAETVDARYIVVKLCSRSGIYPCGIADKIGITVRAVNHILSTFDVRISSRKMMQINYEVIKSKCEEKSPSD